MREPHQVILRGEKKDEPICIGRQLPTVHLPWRQEEDGAGTHGVLPEIDGVRTFSFGEHHQMVKRMPVRTIQVVVMLVEVSAKPADEQTALFALPVYTADVINRECFAHVCKTILQRSP